MSPAVCSVFISGMMSPGYTTTSPESSLVTSYTVIPVLPTPQVKIAVTQELMCRIADIQAVPKQHIYEKIIPIQVLF